MEPEQKIEPKYKIMVKQIYILCNL